MPRQLEETPPRPERLQELRDHVRVLDQLHDDVVALLDANRPEKLVSTISDTVMAVAEEHDASWLRGAADQIHAQWKLIWLTGGAANVEPLRADVGRATRALPAAVNDWRARQDARDSLDAQLTEVRTQPRGNIASQLSASDRETTLQEEVAGAARRAHECMTNVLRVVAPEGYEFEPSRDYEREWLEVEAASDSTDREVKQEAAEQLRRREMADGTVEGTAIGSVPEADAGEVGEGREDDGSSSDEPEPAFGGGSAWPASSDDGAHGAPAATHDDDEKSPETSSESGTALPEAALSADSRVRFDSAIVALWQSVDIRPGIAYHIARLLAEQDCTDPLLPPADVVVAATLADCIRSADGAVVEALRPVLARIEGSPSVQQQDAIGLLLLSGTLRPALLAPVTGAISLLRRVTLSTRFAPVSRLAGIIADHAERLRGIRLDASLLSAAFSATEWQEKFDDFSWRVRNWHDKAEQRRNKAAAARRVWARWLHTDGCLGELVRLLSKKDPGEKQKIQKFLKRLSDPKDFTKPVNETNENETKGREGAHSDVVGEALNQLKNHAQPVLDLGAEWLRLVDVRPDPKGFVENSLVRLRRDLGREAPLVAEVLTAFDSDDLLALRAAAGRAARSVEALRGIISGDEPTEPGGTAQTVGFDERPDAILSRDLLYVTDLKLDATYAPVKAQGGEKTLELLADTDAHVRTMGAACDRRIELGDLTGARLACDFLETWADAGSEPRRVAVKRAFDVRRRNLADEVEKLEEATEEAFQSGQIGGG